VLVFLDELLCDTVRLATVGLVTRTTDVVSGNGTFCAGRLRTRSTMTDAEESLDVVTVKLTVSPVLLALVDVIVTFDADSSKMLARSDCSADRSATRFVSTARSAAKKLPAT
jgi:hypothetical protein